MAKKIKVAYSSCKGCIYRGEKDCPSDCEADEIYEEEKE